MPNTNQIRDTLINGTVECLNFIKNGTVENLDFLKLPGQNVGDTFNNGNISSSSR